MICRPVSRGEKVDNLGKSGQTKILDRSNLVFEGVLVVDRFVGQRRQLYALLSRIREARNRISMHILLVFKDLKVHFAFLLCFLAFRVNISSSLVNQCANVAGEVLLTIK